MLGVRIAISVFVVILLFLVTMGMGWTGQHQAPAAALASRVVLGLSAVFGVVALVIIWRPNRNAQGKEE
jgi:hypothetical protein